MGVEHQFSDALLDMGQLRIAECLGHQQCHAEHEFGLGEVLDRPLMGRMGGRMCHIGGAVEEVHVAQQEDSFPRHQHIVEEDDAIHLLETRAERVVEMRPPQIEALAAQEFEARRAARDREADRERAVVLGVPPHAWRIDADLVRERPQCREDPRAAHDNAGIGLAHDLQCRPFLEIKDAGNRAAALQVDQRMGQRQIVFADVFIVIPHVLGEFGPSHSLREIIRRTGPRGIGHIHEIGGAAHHSAGGPRPVEHHGAALFEILAGARDDERQPDPVAGARRDIGHLVAEFGIALHVVERGDGARAALQPRMVRRVFDPLAFEPDLALLLAQPSEILSSRPRRHHASRPPWSQAKAYAKPG